MSGPGTLRERLVLEAPIETPDGAGGMTRTFFATATLWAEVTPVSARERVLASMPGASVTHRVRVRMRDDVTTQHRLRLGARIFRIVALREAEAARRFLLVDCEERRA